MADIKIGNLGEKNGSLRRKVQKKSNFQKKERKTAFKFLSEKFRLSSVSFFQKCSNNHFIFYSNFWGIAQKEKLAVSWGDLK
ncbi:hypothetical protein ND861_18640 [Leptospira sp. 2 VSF19]|uniref:Uncharacterized protein n=1 Tax=Leptospira soteropolitanensis TaxID=2950025 RepID=A0ABT3MP29_9LEPT|nr:hypothetical protein [Leptospira soteropolitanensis]MCW7502256.1 hypothetical protein [Leptospira soteropolitanensis]MCW7528382.1 hypothetical protein [Leptospira soteropolitanensis]